MYLIEDAIAATVRRVASLVPSSTLIKSLRNDFPFQVVKFRMGCQSSTIEKQVARARPRFDGRCGLPVKDSGLESDATPQIGGAEDLAASHDVAYLADVVDVDERIPIE